MANITSFIVEEELKKGLTAIEISKKYKITRQAVYWHIDKIKKKRKVKKIKKKNYNFLIDWRVYNEGLVKRGEFLLDFDIFKDWTSELKRINQGKIGRPYEYPDSFILFFLRLKSMFKIDYRTLEGVGRKLVKFIFEVERAPDYTTFCVRLSKLKKEIEIYQKDKEQEIAGDTTGLKTSNRGEYRMSKYRGKRRQFVKLHLGVNIKTKQVIWCEITREQVRDGERLKSMIKKSKKYGRINKGYFDAGYDSKDNYLLLKENGIIPIIRPRCSGTLKRTRDRINQTEKSGIIEKNGTYIRLKILEEFLTDREKWKSKYSYGKRWVVEDRYSVYKRLFSEYMYSKKMKNMKSEALIKVNLMNLFTFLLADSKK